MDFCFKFGLVVLEILEFQFSKKELFKTRLTGNLHIWNGTKEKIFDGLFCNFLEINNHNFVKNDPKFENKGLFHAKFYGVWHEKNFRFQSYDIWVVGP